MTKILIFSRTEGRNNFGLGNVLGNPIVRGGGGGGGLSGRLLGGSLVENVYFIHSELILI